MHSVTEILGELLGAGDWMGMLKPKAGLLSDASNLVFFQQINDFLRDEIDEFGINLLGRTMAFIGSIVLTLLTMWIMIQGYRIVTGQSREPMMALVTNSLRAVLIIGVATGLAAGGSTVYRSVTDGLSEAINKVVTGKDESAYASIDRSLGWMQVAMSSIDQLHVGGSEIVNDAKSRNMWFTGIGTGGPAVTAGTMLLLNKIAMALFIGLGPLFIMCLLFDQTKQLFSKWLFYGIGTMFSLAVLSVMVGLAMDITVAVAAAFWGGSFLGASDEGVSSMALQQGGLGLILTMLIISAPPMAATFFNGMLGQFSSYNQFAGSPPPQKQQFAGGGDSAPSSDRAPVASNNSVNTAYTGARAVAQPDVVKTGMGNKSVGDST